MEVNETEYQHHLKVVIGKPCFIYPIETLINGLCTDYTVTKIKVMEGKSRVRRFNYKNKICGKGLEDLSAVYKCLLCH